ncbi:oligosaccharide repeat unit polymerase [Rubritalea squalenifaciens DSM 18772]|uniref:Oligosaccharide repeat unit polymerase n=1 Tax=Rubritalea squalenifaciens DSM 18772 TaxID=1123071 RepID=A0A1M6QZA2_9BACT|nr:O-antigen polymerase [Rubritalea squalenifaciens]SHK25428.1 oligosaccharide repeat unit polymerase [Rubritalea squalenifaciens DSM 18772]
MRVYIQLFYFVLALILKPDLVSSFDPLRVSLLTGLTVASVLTEWCIYGRQKNFFRLDVLFILGFFIVHFQWPLMFLFGVEMRKMSVEASISSINYGTWLSALGLIAWNAGWGAFTFKKQPRKRIIKVEYKKLKIAFVLLFVLFLITAGRDYLTGAIYRGELEGGDYSGAAGGIASYIQLLLGLVLAVLLAYFMPMSGAYIRNGRGWWGKVDKFIPIAVAGYIFMYLAVGDRGGAVQAASVVLILYGVFVKPITAKQFIILALVGAFVLTVIGWGRSSLDEKGKRNIIEAGIEKIQERDDQGFYIYTLTLADSVTCLHGSIADVNSSGGIYWGKLWRGDIFSLVPLLGKYTMTTFGLKNHDVSSSGRLTYLSFGEDSKIGSGSTIIADLYHNWGTAGVVIFMFALGVLYQRVTQGIVRREGFKWVVMAAALATVAFYSSRAGYLIFLRPLVWTYLIAKFCTTVKTLSSSEGETAN